jgi:hypothetical protein
MNTNPSGNGNGQRPWWWLVGALLVPLVLASAGNVLHTTYSNAERISSAEAAQDGTEKRLERIERKLDQILELERRHP